MPRRWLSIRTATQKDEEEKSTPSVAEGFDFAFGIKSHSSLSTPTSPDSTGPYVFTESAHYAKRRPDLSLLIERPQSSRRSSRFRSSVSGPPSANSCIGMAFGSPHHPPHNFAASQIDMTSSRPCFTEHSSPVRTPSVSKWKKIGGLFRPRANSDKGFQTTYQQSVEPAVHKPSFPSYRSRWGSSKSSPTAQDDVAAHNAQPRSEPLGHRPRTSHGYRPRTSQNDNEIPSPPSIQVKIPGSPFERYSVMFKNLNATPQLSLGRRRSFMKDKPTPDPSPISPNQQHANDAGPGLKRRASSPTRSQSSDILPSDEHPTERPPSNPRPNNTSRYSLFPATPTTSRPPSQHRNSSQLSNRPWTAPGQSLPQQNDGSPPKKQRYQLSISNPANTSVDLQKELPCPISEARGEAPRAQSNSRSSSNGEIFFDVKSLRGSRAIDATQYEIARPPSTELQLARSKSSARRQAQKPSRSSPASEQQTKGLSEPTGIHPDTGVVPVEVTTSAGSMPTRQEHQSVTLRKPIPQSPQANNNAVFQVTPVINPDNKRMRSPKSKSEGLNIAVPSPVLESIEEASPRTIRTRHSIALITEGPTPAEQNPVKKRTRANSNDTRTLRASLSKELPLPPPPPAVVPIKDSKFIPLSKYAPKHTAEDLVRQTGLRPVRPSRSNTDDGASYNEGITVFRRQFPARSSTMPSIAGSGAVYELAAQPMPAVCRVTPRPDQEVPMVVAYVQPSAEVSIARTVSLSRKASTKILVSRQPSKGTLKATNKSVEDLTEKKIPQRMPTLSEAKSKHKPGMSQKALIEVESNLPSSPASVTSGCDFTKTLDVFPTPPMLSV